MKLELNSALLDTFPTVHIAALRGRIAGPKGDPAVHIARFRTDATLSLRGRGLTTETLSGHPHVAGWRTTYQAFGVRAKQHRPTHEAMARRLLRDEGWPQINPIVDIYLTNQVEHLLPHGGYDASTLVGDLRLERSLGAESFSPLGGGSEVTEAGEVIYRDEVRILTRRWNYRDCDVTKITADTSDFILMIEGANEQIQVEAINRCVTSLAEKYATAFSGRFDFSTHTFTGASRVADLP